MLTLRLRNREHTGVGFGLDQHNVLSRKGLFDEPLSDWADPLRARDVPSHKRGVA